ncbi:MAG: 30S ribosomal protein S12 methylthiotransferase RimO [Spirochaetales bacterium]|nr:30S ribosomal protein S12 methylthiotransferase RimO [Spirochaetales bacterium]
MSLSFYIESLGCAKNQVESEHAIAVLEASGLAWTDDPAAADCLLVNTCGFIASAKQESIDSILDFRRRFPDKKIVLVGCLAMRYREDLERELGEADGVWGNIRDPGFPEFVAGIVGLGKNAAASGPAERRRLLSYPGSVYVKIAEGCANRCTYCAIPLIRGGLRSRLRGDVVREVRGFLERGIHEVNLIAQDTSSFGLDRGESELAALISEVAGLPGDFWVRLLYIHPDHFTAELLDAVRSSPKILPYFDLPFQHGSSSILRAMNRRGDADSYAALADSIRSALPEAVIRTTFLTGFPGENEDDFDRLLAFQERLRPQWAGVFAFSPEEGTQAFKLRPRVPGKTARKRKAALEERQTEITAAWLDSLVGRKTDVLVEERVEGEDLVLGRAWFQAPEVDGLVVVRDSSVYPGEKIRVLIEGRAGVDLKGGVLP